MRRAVTIAGAGIAGLTAAITLAQQGVPVEVHEQHPEIGMRFHGDIQGIADWDDVDVLGWLNTAGIHLECPWHRPCQVVFFDVRRREYVVNLPHSPLVMVRRGPMADTLDQCLKRQALAAGVRLVFNSRLAKNDPRVDIVATGPRRASAIALGYTFVSNGEPQLSVIFDNAIAPKGYAYLVVAMGHGCMGTVLFTDFHNASVYRQRTLEAFQRLRPFEMREMRPYAGYGEAGRCSPRDKPYVGEAAGLQDALWGFGIRFAMESGYLAAQSILKGEPYWHLVEAHLRPAARRCQQNRIWFARLGNAGGSFLARQFGRARDPRRILQALYRPGLAGWLATFVRIACP